MDERQDYRFQDYLMNVTVIQGKGAGRNQSKEHKGKPKPSKPTLPVKPRTYLTSTSCTGALTKLQGVVRPGLT